MSPLDKFQFGSMAVSRLMVGHNPVCGNSHVSQKMDAEMRGYFTPDNVVAMYSHIKPSNAVAVGFFPKYLDQLSLGVKYASEALG